MRSKWRDRGRSSLSLGALVLASLAIAAGTPAVRVDAAWIRWLPAGLPAAGYLNLTNTGEKPAVLVAASSADYADVSMHRSVRRGGTVEMAPMAQIVIDPHSSLDFATAGYHLMLMQPAKSLQPGDRVPITLRFADGSSLSADFEVRKPDAQ